MLLTVSCRPQPPVVPYLSVSTSGNGCGFDWNGAGILLERAPTLLQEWAGSKEMVLVFRLPPVPDRCVAQAHKVLQRAHFERIYEITTTQPGVPGRPLVP